MSSGNILPMALHESAASDTDLNIGATYRTKEGRRFMLVQNAEGAALASRRTLKWADRDAFTVEYSDSLFDFVAGVTPAELGALTVPDTNLFLMQVGGVPEFELGDGAIAVAAGSLIGPDDDADQGKVGAALAQSTVYGPAALKEEDGTELTGATTPTLTQDANEELVVTWAATVVSPAKLGTGLLIPSDFDTGADVISLVAWVLQTAANDAVSLDAEVYRVRPGVANSADLNPAVAAISQSGAAATPEQITIDLSGNSLLPGDMLDVSVFPTAHANDAITLYGLGLQYQSVDKPANAFAKALEAETVVDGTFRARLIEDRLGGLGIA